MTTTQPLPLPALFEPRRAAEWSYRPDAASLATAATRWRAQHAIRPAAADERRVHLLLIDVQKDFCFPEGTLYVAGRSGTGAIDDSRRIAELIYRNLGTITPLFDQTCVVLGTVIAKAQELAQAGIAVRTVTLLITDGGDYGSRRCKPGDVAALVTDMLAQENHIIAAMGIDDSTTDFRKVFQSMGIPDRWVLTPGNSASEIRRAFQVFSRSAVRASQGAAQLGGFSN